jgi:hypothetical protein
MKNITIYITYYGVHGIVDDAIMDCANAQPKSSLYENIYLPKLQSSLREDINSTLADWFTSITEHDTYNVGLFFNTVSHEPFKNFLNMCPAGTRVLFVKSTLEDHNVHFRYFLKEMLSAGRERIFKKSLRDYNSINTEDIDIEYEEGCVYIDDLADEMGADDWKPFEYNNNVAVREFIKL